MKKMLMGFALSLSLTSGVFAQATAVATGTTVGGALLSATGIVDDIIEDAGNEANYVVFNSAMQMKMLIESFRVSSLDILDEGFDKLNDSQAQLFNNINASLSKLQLAVDQPVAEARKTVEDLKQVVNDATFWSDNPTVTRIFPTVVGPKSNRNDVIVTMRGISFDEGDPKFFIGETEIERISITQQEAKFKVPSILLPHKDNEIEFISGRILIKSKKCKLWFLLCKENRIPFDTAVFTLPNKLAEITVNYNTKKEQRVYSDRTFTRRFQKTTGDLTKFKCSKFNQGAHDANHFIDIDSLKWKTSGKAGKRWKLLNKTPAGYSVELCAKSQIKRWDKKTGVMIVNMSWREYKNASVVSPQKELEIENNIMWDSGQVLALPEEANGISGRIEYFDGTSAAFTGSHEDQYISVLWNAGTKQLQLNSKTPSSIEEIH